MKKRFFLTSLLGLLWLSGCATSPPGARSAASGGAVPAGHESRIGDESSVEITYVLGHNHYHFAARMNGTEVTARSHFDQKVVRENLVKADRYSAFVDKVRHFLASPQREVAADCRSPFIVTLRSGEEIRSAHGCRNADSGGFSHLVNEGEILLYSKK